MKEEKERLCDGERARCVYDNDTRGDDGCPLLVLTPVGGATLLRPPLPTGISGGIG